VKLQRQLRAAAHRQATLRSAQGEFYARARLEGGPVIGVPNWALDLHLVLGRQCRLSLRESCPEPCHGGGR
jgi:hypothetical protein